MAVFHASLSFSTWLQPAPVPIRFPSCRMCSLPGPLCPSRLPPKSKISLWKTKVAGLQTPLPISLRAENCHFVITVLNKASAHHITRKSFAVHKNRPSGVPSLAGSLTSCAWKLSSTHSRNLLDCFLTAVLYLQQFSSKSKSCKRKWAGDCETSPISL